MFSGLVINTALQGAVRAQVVNSEDLTEILGERPYRSSELRNIDKFRDGFAKKVCAPSLRCS